MGVKKRTYFAYFIKLESIYLKSIHSGPNSKATISHHWCGALGLYFDYSRMWRLSTYFEYRRILGSVGINSRKDSLDCIESQMESDNIPYFKFQTCNLDL